MAKSKKKKNKKNKVVDEKINNIEEEKDAVDEKTDDIEEKDNAVDEKINDIEEKDNAVDEKKNDIEEKDNAVDEKINDIEEKDNAVDEKINDIEEKDNAVDEKINDSDEENNAVDEKKSNSHKKKKTSAGKIIVIIAAVLVCAALAAAVVMKVVNNDKTKKNPTEINTQSKTSETIEKPEILDNKFDISLYSKYAVVLNGSKNKVVFSKNADMRCRPASITKILSAIIVLENVKDLDEKTTLSKKDSDFLDQTDLAQVGFKVGEKVTIRDCLYCAILQSSADACLMMSRYVAGSDKKFAEMMNKKISDLGLENCSFDNSIGMDSNGTYITVDEYVLVLEYALKNPEFRKIIRTYQYELKPTNKRKAKWSVTNGLLSNIKDNYLIISGKLGYTDYAEQTLATYSKLGGDYYYIVTAYAKNKSGGGFRNIKDHERLYRRVQYKLNLKKQHREQNGL